ncbi:hypothetical protein TrCOL_g9984 [Triparma columacea]|uniref:Uncharacterized protein n=1 Tax=Triparma columacea TaxID=722753 RepID=A0A9W7L2I9_9STRA|nr:hypothetical protein TrCOL_g9984 [Triparma columacea]
MKEIYPDNVHLVMGNRDVNKMRIVHEIEGFEGPKPSDKSKPSESKPSDSSVPLATPHSGVYWFHNRNLIGDPLLSNVPTSRVSRLRWILRSTMGCPNSFEHRQSELSNRGEPSSEEDVVDSYVETCRPGGLMGRYIMESSTIVKLGPCLFVHGGIPKGPEVTDSKLMGRRALPPTFEGTVEEPETGDWVDAINNWSEVQKSHWLNQIGPPVIWSTKGGYETTPNQGGSLIQYGMGWLLNPPTTSNNKTPPTVTKNPTCVYASWLNKGMPCPSTSSSPSVRNMFTDGVEVIISGHQPHGDAPLGIKVDGGGVIVTGDTSYSGDTGWVNSENGGNKGREGTKSGRGVVAVSEILLQYTTTNSTSSLKSIITRGVLSDGTSYECDGLMKDDVVGREAKDEVFGDDGKVIIDGIEKGRYWIKAKLGEGKYLGCYAKGWEVENKVLKVLDVARRRQ